MKDKSIIDKTIEFFLSIEGILAIISLTIAITIVAIFLLTVLISLILEAFQKFNIFDCMQSLRLLVRCCDD